MNTVLSSNQPRQKTIEVIKNTLRTPSTSEGSRYSYTGEHIRISHVDMPNADQSYVYIPYSRETVLWKIRANAVILVPKTGVVMPGEEGGFILPGVLSEDKSSRSWVFPFAGATAALKNGEFLGVVLHGARAGEVETNIKTGRIETLDAEQLKVLYRPDPDYPRKEKLDPV